MRARQTAVGVRRAVGVAGVRDACELFPFQIYQSWLDKSTPYTAVRWVVTLGLSFVYMIRVYLLQVGAAELSPGHPRLVPWVPWAGSAV